MIQSGCWWMLCLVCLGVFALKISANDDEGNPDNWENPDNVPIEVFAEEMPRLYAPRAVPAYIWEDFGRNMFDDNVVDMGWERRRL